MMNLKKSILTIIILTGIVALLRPCLSFSEDILITADKQTFDGKTTNFSGNVIVEYEDITIKSPKAIVTSDKNGKPATATFLDKAIAIKKTALSKSEVKANIINLSLLKNKITAEGNAESSVFKNKEPIVHIKAKYQEFDTAKNIIIASDDVVIKYKEITTYSNKAKITINEEGKLKKVDLAGSVKILQDKKTIKASEVLFNPITNEIVAYGNTSSFTTLDDGSFVKIWADFQQYDNASNTLITSGHVKIKYKNYTATGPKATFVSTNNSSNPNKIIFIGRAKIQEDNKNIEADRIEITMDPQNFTAEGNVRTRLTKMESLKKINKK